MVIGESTAAMLQQRFAIVELDRIAVKGKKDAVTIYTVLGDASYEYWDKVVDLLPHHENFLDNYRRQKWNSAEKLAKSGASFAPLKQLYNMYLDRINEYRSSPPIRDWDGVYRALSK